MLSAIIWLFAATLTFADTSGTESGFIVQIIKADGTIRFQEFPSLPGTGTVIITLPNDGPGDCFSVAAYNAGGVSAFTPRVCLAAAAPNPPNAPTGAGAKL